MKKTQKYKNLGFFIAFLTIYIFPLCAESEDQELIEPFFSTEELQIIIETATEHNDIFLLSEEIENDKENSSISVETTYDDYDDLDSMFIFEADDLVIEAPVFEPRSYKDIFPNFTPSQLRNITNTRGLRNAFESGGEPSLLPSPDSGINLINSVMQKNPSHIVEALIVIPYTDRELDLLDIYNALGRIEQIKNQSLPQRNGGNVFIFKDTTRLVSASNRKAISDPLPSNSLPFSETMYLRFTDAYIGNLFLKGDISLSYYGLTYNMTNFRDVNYSVFRIMKAERVSIILYLEPVKEGILIYSMSGLYLPEFISKRLNLSANINNRITILVNWITEGLRNKEVLAVERDINALRNGLIRNDSFTRLLNN